MKIRSGFVSNSSSSSFIIAFDTNKFSPCPHCGRRDLSIVDMVKHSRNGDNQVAWDDAQERIRRLREEISEIQEEIILLQKRRGEKFNEFWTVDDKINYLEGSISESEAEIAIIEDAVNKGLSVACIEVSYHDEHILDEIDNLQRMGKLEVLNRND